MAIYHTSVKTFSRAKGHSSVAAAAYRAGLLLADDRTGTRHDYRRRGGVVETRCIVPADAPDWTLDPATLWPAAEAAEKRKDATVAREFEIALPHELSTDQRSELAMAIAQALVERYRFVAQASIHAPDTRDGLNFHVHILATTRRAGAGGLEDKTRELDGGAAGRVEVQWIRETVACLTNAHLAAAGIAAEVDHRSLKDQAEAALARGDLTQALLLSREPTRHLGKAASGLDGRGAPSERAEENDRIARENEARFDALLADFEREGRLTQPGTGHGLDQAKRDRRRAREGAAIPLGTQPRGGEMRGVRGTAGLRIANLVVPPRTPGPSADELLKRSVRVWLDAAMAALSERLSATRRLLERASSWLAEHADVPRLRADLRELLKRLTTLRRWANEWGRREAAERRADVLLNQAERSLEVFVEQHPVPGEWPAREWARRRGRRLLCVEQRLGALKAARDATSGPAQAMCEEKLEAALRSVEGWSAGMTERYPGAAVRPIAPTHAPPSLLLRPGRRPRLH